MSAVMHRLPCDIFLASHGSIFGMLSKLQRAMPDGPNPFVDPVGYQQALAAKDAEFHRGLARQQAGGDAGQP